MSLCSERESGKFFYSLFENGREKFADCVVSTRYCVRCGIISTKRIKYEGSLRRGLSIAVYTDSGSDPFWGFPERPNIIHLARIHLIKSSASARVRVAKLAVFVPIVPDSNGHFPQYDDGIIGVYTSMGNKNRGALAEVSCKDKSEYAGCREFLRRRVLDSEEIARVVEFGGLPAAINPFETVARIRNWFEFTAAAGGLDVVSWDPASLLVKSE